MTTPNRTLPSITPLLIAGGIALAGCLLVGGTLFFALRPQSSSATATMAATRVSSFPTATAQPSPTPSPTSTFTPAPTNTLPSTATSAPPTNSSATKIPSTAVPTNTPVPPAAPGAAHGLRVDYFSPMQTTYAAGSDIGFKFIITNIGADRVGFGYLGAYFADMNGTKIHYQTSYAGGVGGDPKYWLQPGGQLPWDDYWRGGISTPGTYQVKLLVCYTGMPECNGGAGDWEDLSPYIQITIT